MTKRLVRALVSAGFISALTLEGVKANMPDSTKGKDTFKIEALCTIANSYSTCHPQFKDGRLVINFPTELVVLRSRDIKEVKVYDSRTRELLRLFAKTGDLDFAISFSEGDALRTGFVRFKNNQSGRQFLSVLKGFAAHAYE